MKSTTLNMYRVVDFACVDMYISTLFYGCVFRRVCIPRGVVS